MPGAITGYLEPFLLNLWSYYWTPAAISPRKPEPLLEARSQFSYTPGASFERQVQVLDAWGHYWMPSAISLRCLETLLDAWSYFSLTSGAITGCPEPVF